MCKGAIVGGTMLVPGVSGGTMAIILGIYDQLVHAVASFRRQPRQNLLFLFLFCVGGGLGMLLFSRPLLSLLNAFPLPMGYFFIGAVAGSIPMIYQKSQPSSFSWHVPVYVLAGVVIVSLFSVLPTGVISSTGSWQPLLLIVTGIVAAAALVLPGISVSYLLLMLGLYDKTIAAISHLQFSFLLPLFIGLCIGILLVTKILERLMDRHPRPTYLVILGFMLASIASVFPGLPSLAVAPACVLTFAAGFFIIYRLSKL
mgnify:FL=1